MDGLAGRAERRGGHGQQPAQVNRLTAVTALAETVVVQAMARGQNLFQFMRGMFGLGLLHRGQGLAGSDVLEVDHIVLLGLNAFFNRVAGCQQGAQFGLPPRQQLGEARCQGIGVGVHGVVIEVMAHSGIRAVRWS